MDKRKSLFVPAYGNGTEIFMRQSRVVTIQDISCFGKCSLTVALPIISAMGVETAIIPTAVLSTHTGGFENFTFHDLTVDIPKIAEHWRLLDLNFDVIYTGYLGSFEQLEYISDFIDSFKTKNNIVMIDPVMGDNGTLYTGFTKKFALSMAQLCKKADVIVPNLTEAAYMLDEPYAPDGYDEEYIRGLLKRLCKTGAKSVILTGVSYSHDKIGAVAYSAQSGEYCEYFTERIGEIFHGTGDIFASVCAGALARGVSMKESIKLAADYVLACIRATAGHEKEHWYGVRFEDCIPQLTKKLDRLIDLGGNNGGKRR